MLEAEPCVSVLAFQPSIQVKICEAFFRVLPLAIRKIYMALRRRKASVSALLEYLAQLHGQYRTLSITSITGTKTNKIDKRSQSQGHKY